MKVLQKIALSVAFATSLLAVSNVAVAEAKESTGVQAMIESTIHHTEAALAATTSGNVENNKDTILAHIKAARQAQKDIIVGALDQQRQKASSHLIVAGRDIKEGKTNEAQQALKEAVVSFNELLAMANKTK